MKNSPRNSKKFILDESGNVGYKTGFILVKTKGMYVDEHNHVYEVSYLGEEEFSRESVIIDFYLTSCKYGCKEESKPFIHKMGSMNYKVLNPQLAKSLFQKEVTNEARTRLVNGVSKTSK